MRRFWELCATLAVMAGTCRGTLVPAAGLAQAVRSADVIIVGRVVSGMGHEEGAIASAEVRLTVVRTLKGNVAAGSTVAVRSRGKSLPIVRVPNTPVTWSVKPFTALWFLGGQQAPYTIVPVTPGAGDLDRASLWLPDESKGGQGGTDVTSAVAAEVVAGLRTISALHPDEIRPGYRLPVGSSVDAGKLAQRTVTLSETLATLNDRATLVPIYRELASDASIYLRSIGVAGLIADGDPAGPKQAAAEFRALVREGYAAPIVMSLSGYRTATDADALVALGRIAIDDADLEITGMLSHAVQRNAVESLLAVHSKETMPALAALLDSPDAVAVGRALVGMCLFVRNNGVITMASVPSFSWMNAVGPAPFRTAQTDAYCNVSASTNDNNPPEVRLFWKKWWQEHVAEVMK